MPNVDHLHAVVEAASDLRVFIVSGDEHICAVGQSSVDQRSAAAAVDRDAADERVLVPGIAQVCDSERLFNPFGKRKERDWRIQIADSADALPCRLDRLQHLHMLEPEFLCEQVVEPALRNVEVCMGRIIGNRIPRQRLQQAAVRRLRRNARHGVEQDGVVSNHHLCADARRLLRNTDIHIQGQKQPRNLLLRVAEQQADIVPVIRKASGRKLLDHCRNFFTFHPMSFPSIHCSSSFNNISYSSRRACGLCACRMPLMALRSCV